MNVLTAVIDDLYSFAVGSLLRGVSRISSGTTAKKRAKKSHSAPLPAPVMTLPEAASSKNNFRTAAAVIEEKTVDVGMDIGQDAGDSAGEDVGKDARGGAVDVLETPMDTAAFPKKNTLMYVGGNETPIYGAPTREFDGVISRLPYGAMVMVLDQKGRWARVVYNTLSGWMLREELVDRAAHVYPHFVVGEENRADDPNTVRVRAMIDDTFAGGDAELDLQAPEYVLYRLMRKGIAIDWPEGGVPRTPGLWHTLLRGVLGVHVGVTPKAGTIIEYMYTEDSGHLAFVEAVFPDETINISEVNYPHRGVYNERTIARDEWRELKPLFIQVT